MVTITAKSTSSLDVDTGRKLEESAKQADSVDNEALAALDRLQSLLALDQDTAGLWADQVRQERRAARRNISWIQE